MADIGLASIIREAGWTTRADAVTAYAVAMAESGGRQSATNQNTNGSTDYGLFQINTINKPPPEVKTNALANARFAHGLFVQRGWQPWVAYKSGSYRKFLPEADAAYSQLEKMGATWTGKPTAESPTVSGSDAITVGYSSATSAGVLPDVGSAVNKVLLTLVALVIGVMALVILMRSFVPAGRAVRTAKSLVTP